MEIQFDQTKQDLFAFSRHVCLRRKFMWVFFTLYPLASLYFTRSSSPAMMLGVAVLAYFGVAVLIFGLQLLIAWGRLSSPKYRYFLSSRTCRLDDSGIEVVTEDSTSKVGWRMIQKVASTKHYLFIYITPINGFIVPRRVFSTEGAFQEFADKIRHHAAEAR